MVFGKVGAFDRDVHIVKASNQFNTLAFGRDMCPLHNWLWNAI